MVAWTACLQALPAPAAQSTFGPTKANQRRFTACVMFQRSATGQLPSSGRVVSGTYPAKIAERTKTHIATWTIRWIMRAAPGGAPFSFWFLLLFDHDAAEGNRNIVVGVVEDQASRTARRGCREEQIQNHNACATAGCRAKVAQGHVER